MPARTAPRDPWRDAPTSELQDQVLPRWFVLTAVIMVPLAVVALVAAFVVFGPEEVPVVERRPPPAAGRTHGTSEVIVGDSEPVAADVACPALEGVRVAGTETDRDVLTRGLNALCGAGAPAPGPLEEFADERGVVRFAQLAETGLDSTAALDGSEILVNARFSVTEPDWIAPLVVHEVTDLAGEPGTAVTELDARTAEAAACSALFSDRRPSRACDDAAALLELPDPLAALRDAGYR